MSSTTTTVKGFKVTDAKRKARVGIAVRSLDDLRKKTSMKFNIKIPIAEISFQTPDGTLIDTDEYLSTLPAQTLLIWLKDGEKAETDAEILYRTIREVNEEYLTAGQKVQEFFTEKMKSKVYKLAEVLKNIDDEKLKLSIKEDHPEWFEGLDTRAKTKEEYMFRRAQDRIRGYFYKTKDELKHKSLPKQKLDTLLKQLQDKLQNVRYFGYYFDRRYAASNSINNVIVGDYARTISICDEFGKFTCKGRWDKDHCLYEHNNQHEINPYKSREARIIFQTWNLDHVIERSRSIIPAVCDALLENEKINVNKFLIDVDNVFCDLFTLKNLKFVHIVCHDKGTHDKFAGSYLL